MPLLWENTGNELLEVFPESIDQLIDKLINTSNVMIMDLEFFNDNREDHTKEQRMAQIAGMMLNDSSQKFNFNIFDNEKMSVKDQLNY